MDRCYVFCRLPNYRLPNVDNTNCRQWETRVQTLVRQNFFSDSWLCRDPHIYTAIHALVLKLARETLSQIRVQSLTRNKKLLFFCPIQEDAGHYVLCTYKVVNEKRIIGKRGLRRRGTCGCWGPFLTSPLGANFDPQGRSCPQGVSLSPRDEVIPWGWNSLFAPPLF
jgi:hypothetical protein